MVTTMLNALNANKLCTGMTNDRFFVNWDSGANPDIFRTRCKSRGKAQP